MSSTKYQKTELLKLLMGNAFNKSACIQYLLSENCTFYDNDTTCLPAALHSQIISPTFFSPIAVQQIKEYYHISKLQWKNNDLFIDVFRNETKNEWNNSVKKYFIVLIKRVFLFA